MISLSMRRALGKGWICVTLLCIVSLVFAWILPAAVSEVTQGGLLVPKILDQYVMTWTASDARHFYETLGVAGRDAYRNYYLKFDFWFPVLSLSLFYVSLLSLAFPAGSRLSWLNLTPVLLWLSDVAENLNHFTMAGDYPNLSPMSLAVGPAFTFVKWMLIFGLLLLALTGAAIRIVSSRNAARLRREQARPVH